MDPDYVRPQAFDLANLAGSHALARVTETAITVGHQAADAIMELRPVRAGIR
ncbi:MAG TPA: hypothetical protein VGJ13_07945 [Pseudonocardiaceae bacterium]